MSVVKYSRCSVCGKKTAICSAVSGKQGIGRDGRRWGMLKMGYNCTACFAEVNRAIKVVETLKRDDSEVIVIGVRE